LVALVQVKQYLLEWMMGLSPLGNLCVKKQQNKNICKENPNIAKKSFTTKENFSKLSIRQRCREN
jgi:hypothetical protein